MAVQEARAKIVAMDALLELFMHTTRSRMIDAAAWSAWCLAAMATAEYLAHKYLMHRPRPLRGLFGHHAIQHHAKGQNEAIHLDLSPAWALAYTSPLWGPLALTGSHMPAAIVAAHAAGYAVLWTGLHRAMHDVGGAWAARLPIYPALLRHHLGHHRHPGRNFGAVFGPVLDFLCGTLAPKIATPQTVLANIA